METLQPSQHPITPQNSVNEPKRLRAGEGVSWFTDSWRIFSKNKFKWMGAIILISLIPIAVGFLFGLLGIESPPADFNNFNDFTSTIIIRELLFNLFFYWVGFCSSVASCCLQPKPRKVRISTSALCLPDFRLKKAEHS